MPTLSLPAKTPHAKTLPVVSRFRSMTESRGMIENPIEVFSRYTAALGDTFRFYFGGAKEAIVTSNPAVIQHVLKTNSDNYHKSEIQMKRMGHFLGKGLLTSHGEVWKIQRRLIQKGFKHDRLVALAEIMQDSLAESVADFDREVRQGPVDIYIHLMRMTFRMVGRSLFGAQLRDQDIRQISRTISTVQEFMVRQIVQPYLDPWFALSGELRRHEEMREQGDAIVMDYIKKRRAGEPADDLMQILLDARYTDGTGMSDEVVLSESMQLMVAGHETSSNALSWMLYLLSRNPEYIERMREEFDAVLGDRPLGYADVAKFDFVIQVVQESLRLYPPFWMVDRVALEDDRVDDIAIPRGSTVIVFIYGAHHSPEYWDEPERFDPSRFSKANEKNHRPFSHLPFGAGPRGCIGGNYATLQILMILSVLLRKYDLQLAPGQTVETRPMIILRPKDGIKMTFRDAVRSHVAA
jgi:cytochrome P450